MEAIPEIFAAADIASKTNRYRCPLCKAQTTEDPADTGWVRCPMLRDTFICLGCCIDHQSVARAENFDAHPYRDLFDGVSKVGRIPARRARLNCLEHQEGIILRDLRSQQGAAEHTVRKMLLNVIREAMKAT